MTGKPAGVILAGGRSTRMGGADKSLAMLAGRPLVERIADRLRPQVVDLAINANGDPARFAKLAAGILPDTLPAWPGPLAGILAGLQWATGRAARLVTVPADTPFIPADLARRLAEASPDGLALAASGGRIHPVAGLWPVGLRDDLATFLAGGNRKVTDFTDAHNPAVVHFDLVPLTNGRPIDPFFNINTPADLAEAEAAWAMLPS